MDKPWIRLGYAWHTLWIVQPKKGCRETKAPQTHNRPHHIPAFNKPIQPSLPAQTKITNRTFVKKKAHKVSCFLLNDRCIFWLYNTQNLKLILQGLKRLNGGPFFGTKSHNKNGSVT